MARKDASLLGIDLHEGEIRVVQIRMRANKSSIAKVGKASMPQGAIIRGKVMQPGAVAIALRLLLNSMEVGTNNRAVIGVLGDTTLLRTLPVPPVPDSDLPAIVSGEVDHYGIVKTEGGTHGFLRLFPPPPRNTDPNSVLAGLSGTPAPNQDDVKPVNVTIVALEEDVIANLRETVHEANLTIDALEPTQYAMYRSVMLSSGAASSAFGLMINPSNTDIAISYKGNLVAYRRIDVGSRAILLNTPAHIDYGYVEPSHDVFVDDLMDMEPAEIELNYAAVESLSVEVQRTLDYYQREFPNIGIGDTLYLALDDSRLTSVSEELSQRLGVTIELVQPPSSPNDYPEATAELASGAGPIYAAAYGLAVQGAVMTKVPRLDLFTKERKAVLKAETTRNFRGSIITSIVAIVLGSVGYEAYARQIAQLNQEIKTKQETASDLRAKTNLANSIREKQAEQFKALRHEGLPLTAMMDYISGTIDSRTGLSQVVIAPDLTITIDGSSTNEKVMIDTLTTLQGCPVLRDLTMVHFEQLSEEAGYGVGFTFRGKSLSLDKVEYMQESSKP